MPFTGMTDLFPIVGGGPAGAAAALALARDGGRPVVYEKSPFPRHKLCGEFFSPESLRVLEDLGVADRFLAHGPTRITHSEMNFAGSFRRFPLPEAGYGLSRYVFDEFLLRAAVERGAELRRECAYGVSGPGVAAAGRAIVAPRGRRLFGFKSHFAGPQNDAVELFFFEGGYCGLCVIEGGRTNLCGIATEDLLAVHDFRPDPLLETVPRLRERLAPLERVSRWYMSGPLRFGRAAAPDSLLPAGDATCFVDPFTGTGLLGALQTGAWAGAAVLRVAEGASWTRLRAAHERRCGAFYARQLATTGLVRLLLRLGWAESLAGWFPGSLLFRLTRPGW
jgi:flavin-dependent dehydrogenase